jgi:uncharacterized protein involved in exopolysaccharide biosynthesis
MSMMNMLSSTPPETAVSLDLLKWMLVVASGVPESVQELAREALDRLQQTQEKAEAEVQRHALEIEAEHVARGRALDERQQALEQREAKAVAREAAAHEAQLKYEKKLRDLKARLVELEGRS